MQVFDDYYKIHCTDENIKVTDADTFSFKVSFTSFSGNDPGGSDVKLQKAETDLS